MGGGENGGDGVLGGGGLGEGGGGDGDGGGGEGLGGGGDGGNSVPATSVQRPSKRRSGLCDHIVLPPLRIIYISEPGTALYQLWLGSGTSVHCNSLSGNKEVTYLLD